MNKQIDIETPRLLLRRWQETDLEPFTRMNADPEVMRYFLARLDDKQTKQFYDTIQEEFAEYGYGLYAAEEKSSGSFMGFIGFHWARMDVDFCPCVEIGWRLDKQFWGQGYAPEGAAACLEHGFTQLGLEEVHSFTAIQNTPSQRVMQKIGLTQKQLFDHPAVPLDHPLRPHVCYYLNKEAAQLK